MSSQTLLVALDLDESAEAVLQVAMDQASRLGARLVLAHVTPETALPFPEARLADAGHPAGLPQDGLLLDAARQRIDDLGILCADANLSHTVVVVRGDPASTILDLADAHHADIIVLGTHGRRGLARVLVGSVAENILRRANVPVLVVRIADPAHP